MTDNLVFNRKFRSLLANYIINTNRDMSLVEFVKNEESFHGSQLSYNKAEDFGKYEDVEYSSSMIEVKFSNLEVNIFKKDKYSSVFSKFL